MSRLIIDFHTHVFPPQIAEKTLEVLKANVYNVRGVKVPAYTEGTVESLRQSMTENEIDISIVMPIATKPKQTPTINDYAEEITGGNIISFGSLHPMEEDWEFVLEDLAKRSFKGIKIHPQYQNVYVDSPEVIRIVKKAESLGLYTMFHAGVDIGVPTSELCTPERLKKLLEYVSGKYIISAHLGSFEMWDDVEKYLVGSEMYFDISYACSHIEKEQFLRIIRNHGADKILYGSDSPWKSQSSPLEELKKLDLTQEEMDLITHKNAIKILDLRNF